MRNFISILLFSLFCISNLYASENSENREEGVPFFNSLVPELNTRNILIEYQNLCVQKYKDMNIEPLEDHHMTLPGIVLPNLKPSDLNGKMRRIYGEKVYVYEGNNPVYERLKEHRQTKYLQENLNKHISHFKIKAVSNFNGFLVFEIEPVFNKTTKVNKDRILASLSENPHISLFKMGPGKSGNGSGLTGKDQDSFISLLQAKFNKGELDVKIKFDKINFNVDKKSKGNVILK